MRCVVLKEGQAADEAEIRTFCEGKIAHYKVPRYVRFVESFPTTVTGKVQKFVLRAETAAELGLAEEDGVSDRPSPRRYAASAVLPPPPR